MAEDFLSFVRTTSLDSELMEFLSFDVDEDVIALEFSFSGNYVHEENLWQGIWELVVDEQQDGLQETFITEFRTGGFYMRKI